MILLRKLFHGDRQTISPVTALPHNLIYTSSSCMGEGACLTQKLGTSFA